MRKILSVGHGPQPKPNRPGIEFVTLDYVKYPDIDVVWDLEKHPLPFKDDEFDEVLASHVIEHVSKYRYDRLMEEIYRITKNGGMVRIRLPFFSFFTAFHPDHKNTFTYTSFNKFEPGHALHAEKKASFRIVRRKIIFGTNRYTRIFNPLFNPVINAVPMLYSRFFCWILPCEELQFDLQTIK